MTRMISSYGVYVKTLSQGVSIGADTAGSRVITVVRSV